MLNRILEPENIKPEDLLKSILDSAIFGLIVFKAIKNDEGEIKDFLCLSANDKAAEYLSIKKGGFDDTLVSQIKIGEIGDDLIYYGKQTTLGKKLTVFEKSYELNHSTRWFKFSSAPLAEGFITTFQEITDIKEKSQESTTRGRKYRQLFEESIDAIFIADENFDFLDANPSFQNLFGFNTKELKCMSFPDIFSDNNNYQLFRKVLLDQGKSEEFETSLKNKANKEKPCLINCVTIKDDVLEMKTYLGIIRDMTKRKQAERELLMAEKLSMTGKIARTIAHEVRNPLTNLSLALQQLRDEVPAEVDDAELYFNIIQRNADRISNLITDLLNSSKTKALKLEKYSLNIIVREALDLVKDRLQLQSIKLYENYEEGLPEIPLDREQFKVALLNLLVNAIEAMKPEQGELTIETLLEDDRVKLIFRDNGRGISKENLQSLFEPFFTAKKDGTGLGLTAVQNIVHSHKGHIEVDSQVGKGTEFTISFRKDL